MIDYETSRRKYDDQAEFLIGAFWLCGNTGTYVDAPIHRHRGAADLADLSLTRLTHVPIALIDVPVGVHREIDARVLEGLTLKGKAVIFRTGWSRHWRSAAYFGPNPHLTRDTCAALVDHGVALAGIDSVNIDDIGDLARPAHTILLGAGIPICEHLTGLEALHGRREFLHAAPVAWKGGATFPVRAYALRAAR